MPIWNAASPVKKLFPELESNRERLGCRLLQLYCPPGYGAVVKGAKQANLWFLAEVFSFGPFQQPLLLLLH